MLTSSSSLRTLPSGTGGARRSASSAGIPSRSSTEAHPGAPVPSAPPSERSSGLPSSPSAPRHEVPGFGAVGSPVRLARGTIVPVLLRVSAHQPEPTHANDRETSRNDGNGLSFGAPNHGRKGCIPSALIRPASEDRDGRKRSGPRGRRGSDGRGKRRLDHRNGRAHHATDTRQEVRRGGLHGSDARGSMGHPTDPRNVRRSHVRESGACSRTLIWTDCSDSGAERIPQLIKAVGDTTGPPCRGLEISRSVPSRLPLVERPREDTLSACHDLEGT
jgi:hypothetical protein